jgi:hypothetical protein
MVFYIMVEFTGTYVTFERQVQSVPYFIKDLIKKLRSKINEINEKKEKEIEK